MKSRKTYYLYEVIDDTRTGVSFAKTFTYDDYSTGDAVATSQTVTDNDIFDNLRRYENYSFRDLWGTNNPVTALKHLWDTFVSTHNNELCRMLSALATDYNPLDNVCRYGLITTAKTGTEGISGANGNTRTLNTTNAVTSQNTRTDNLSQSVSNTSTQTNNTTDSTTYNSTVGTTTTAHTDSHVTPQTTTTHSEGSMENSTALTATSSDSASAVTVTDNWGATGASTTNGGSDSVAHTGTVGLSGSGTTTNTGTVGNTGSQSTTDTGTVTDSGTNTSTTTYNTTETVTDSTHGNIGTTMTTDILSEELKYRKHSFIDYLLTYFIALNCVYIEGIDFCDM